MARLTQIVVDCSEPAALARFWAAALDDFDVRPYDDEELRRLAGLGLTRETDPTVMLDGPGMEICFQKTADRAGSTKRRLHLDVRSSERDAEVHRLVEHGAELVAEYPGHSWMRDPEGNDFCVVG